MMKFFRRLFSSLSSDEVFENLSENDKIGKLDRGALSILHALNESGGEAYIVGGSVRDLLLGKIPNDWDITTSVRPDDVQKIIEDHGWKLVNTGGKKFGTVVAVVNGRPYEITTFRKEIYGSDSHRPEKVEYADTLKEDLARRDFTVNAMAIDENGVVFDYFDGQKDLDRKVLRTVGKSSQRFQEDALRMFRACRFLSQLNFTADMSLVEGMKDAFYRVEGLSLERVKSEIDRLLVTDHPAKGLDLLVRSGLNETSCHVKKDGRVTSVPILPELTHLVDLPQMKKFHRYDGWMHTLVVVQHTEPKLINRWAGLLHDVGKGMPGVRAVQGNKITDYGHDKKGAAMADAILARWQFPDDFRRRVVWLVKDHMKYHYFANVPEANTVKWVRHLAVSGQFSSQKDLHEAIEEMTDITCADIIGCGFPFASTEGHRSFGEYMEKIIDQTPVTTKELHFDSSVPKALGPYVKQGMKNLLMRVQNGTLENNNSSLYQAAVNFRRRRERETSKS